MRSGLVSVLALIEEGMKAADAIALLREKRSPAVLCNRASEEWLLTRDNSQYRQNGSFALQKER